ncbi:MAG: polysaccharide deacetylase family protein [Myxococcales bacterium]|nr:polysaccharide deacetylase family protein [Myxococcales bacterium]
MLWAIALHARPPRWPQPAGGASSSGSPEVLFTFDDGPHEDFTPALLDLLAQHSVRGVFFWSGWRVSGVGENTETRRKIALRALAEGHLVGNHTVNHAHLCQGSAANAELEVDENARIMAALARMPVSWMRVPYGSRCPRVEAMLAARGLKHLHWDLDPREYLTHDVGRATAYLVSRIRRLENDERVIVLMHDTYAVSVETLSAVLDWIVEENSERERDALPPIRIIGYEELARDQLAPGVAEVVDAAPRDLVDTVIELTRRLVRPLLPPLPGDPAYARFAAGR